MKGRILVILAIGMWSSASGAELTFTGSQQKPITVQPESSTGLNAVYVLPYTPGVIASYTAKNGSVAWLRYSSFGGGYAEEVATTKEGDTYSITLGADDMGYIIEDGTDRFYCWIVNYANHYAQLDGLHIAEEQDCARARLELVGNASKITYYTITGVPKELSRELELTYNSLEYDEASEMYLQTQEHAVFSSIDGTFGAPAPLCDTEFTLSGDRFLEAWGTPQEATSSYFKAIAVEAKTTATQEIRENSNEQKVEGGTLGGSAPAVVEFRAAVTDAAIFREWEFSKDPEFEVVDDRFQELEFTYTFTDQGTTYVRFVANNADGTCEFYGDTYDVFIGESNLECPNAFSPGDSEGVNDEWKVSYKSIVSFECHIFNRWGQEMCAFKDPSMGWDGKYKGKLVPAGVYYYVIKAEGADGKRYNLSGDINIIKHRVSTSPETGEAL